MRNKFVKSNRTFEKKSNTLFTRNQNTRKRRLHKIQKGYLDKDRYKER